MARLARFVHEGLFLRVWLGWVGVQRLASPRGLERFVGLVLLGWAGLAGWFALRHRRIDTFLIRSQPTLIIAIAYLAISRHGRTNEAFSFGHRPPGVLHRIHSVRHLHLHLHPHHEAIIMIDVVINVTVQDLVFFFFYLFFFLHMSMWREARRSAQFGQCKSAVDESQEAATSGTKLLAACPRARYTQRKPQSQTRRYWSPPCLSSMLHIPSCSWSSSPPHY
ncbi:hypothetical protein HDK90DRAFT_109845 [Phyllosticta capitalensis]|uniref:Uncharacterized protein n=1 Tax=Phyllosticta capitalensis TaxID=121624 RepID=A0ABR1YBH7_9PEZI